MKYSDLPKSQSVKDIDAFLTYSGIEPLEKDHFKVTYKRSPEDKSEEKSAKDSMSAEFALLLKRKMEEVLADDSFDTVALREKMVSYNGHCYNLEKACELIHASIVAFLLYGFDEEGRSVDWKIANELWTQCACDITTASMAKSTNIKSRRVNWK